MIKLHGIENKIKTSKLVNFDLSENQELFKSTAERFLQSVDVAERIKQRKTEFGYDKSRWSSLAELGLLAIAADEKNGGMSGSMSDLSTIAQTFGRQNSVDPWLENGALPTLIANKANASEILEHILDGSKISALAFAEPKGRYELTPQSTTATQKGDSYIISGEKQFVLGGKVSDLLFVTAKTDDEFGIFAIPKDTKGIISRYYRIADGSQAAVVEFQSVSVPASAKLNLSFFDFENIIAEVSALACAEMVGLSQLVFHDTVEFVKERKQFGVSIGSFQAIQHNLAECFADLEQIRSTLLRILLVPAANDDDKRAKIYGAKAFISKRAQHIAQRAVQYHGAMGITEEVAIGHALKRILLLARLFGDTSTCLDAFTKAA